MRRTTLAFFITLLAGCTSLVQDSLDKQYDKQYGPADPKRFDHPVVAPTASVTYQRDVRPILEKRCVVCHSCYDAPCQLKLTSMDGMARGATKAQVYDPIRLDEAPLTRLYIDAQQASQWRDKGFYPVLNERTPSAANNLAASVLYRAIALKRAHPLPQEPVLSKDFDFALDRSQSCPRLDEFDAYEREHPLGGMPYGLPGLSENEIETLTTWLAAGSPEDAPQPLPAHITRQVQEWERFLNGDSRKEQLMSRYLYEHLFIGHLTFEGDGPAHVFRLVRSANAPGTPVVPLATRRPFDDPGVARVYYRLQPELETIVAKTHMPYVLSPARMAKYKGWFIEPDYKVDALPSYELDLASNPFVTFKAIPADSRYRFMLDESQFFVMNFIKGPVCRGQTALNVINDRFWVFFFDPKASTDEADSELMHRSAHALRLPAAFGSDASLRSWRQLAESENEVLAAKSEFYNRRFGGQRKLSLSDVWSGDGTNPNAALTVLRQYDSASVVKGLVGEPPKTAWVMGYPLFERIYYLLVAGYDVYGNLPHQLNSRLYMDFMRMEGESNFLMLMPKASRDATRDYWYRDASNDVKAYVNGSKGRFDGEPGIAYRTNDPQRELYSLLRGRLAPVLDQRFDLAKVPDATLRKDLQQLAQVRGASLSWLPESVFLNIVDAPAATRYFSVVRNTGHKNVSRMLFESSALAPDENTLTVVPGFIGSYPNVILRAKAVEVADITKALGTLASEADYRAFLDRFAVRRTSPEFWPTSDALNEAYAKWAPLEAGLFDLNRLENR